MFAKSQKSIAFDYIKASFANCLVGLKWDISDPV